jgi:uncharacterized tellurite resistance protein B-like protein
MAMRSPSRTHPTLLWLDLAVGATLPLAERAAYTLAMPAPEVPNHPSLFTRTLDECRELYVSSGQLCEHEYPHLIARHDGRFVELMDDLHRALVLKVYFNVCESDRKWSEAERFLAEVLFEHLWGKRLTGEKLRAVARKAAEDTSKLKWYSLIRPFDRIVPLRERVGTLETLVMRLANLVARADGSLNEKEAGVIKSIQAELHHHLRAIPIDEPTEHEETNAVSAQAIEALNHEGTDIYAATHGAGPLSRGGKPPATGSEKATPHAPQQLEEALAELDELIGLEQIKHEVRTLTNYLKLQQRRGAAGLPGTEMSLHMVFTGNPGTGKTTVARILGKILGAMGVLQKGHLVETDRSGLVAEYMGQTGPKTQAKINEALDGVLFIDEAYSLALGEGQDTYGCEAIQTLLKRAEDDRQRLVVILAGYPNEMHLMLKSNPGLSSRFSRTLHFEDYSPIELARIFAWQCDKNHFKLSPGTRARLMLGLVELHRRRDRHFGNGRAARNLFEHAIRRMANRIADIRELSAEQLTRLESEDIEFKSLPADFELDSSDNGPWRFRIACPGCSHATGARGTMLGQKVRCPKCEHDFVADWGEPVAIS